jgi:hypothetical protein
MLGVNHSIVKHNRAGTDALIRDYDFIRKDKLHQDIEFSRSSSATQTNSSGLVAFARNNLLSYSEDFSNSYWSKIVDCTAVASNVTDPFGGTGAYKVTETGTNSHLVKTSIATTGQVKSIYARTVSGTGVVDVLGVSSVARYGVTLTEEWQRFDFVVDTSEAAGSHVYGVDFRSGD